MRWASGVVLTALSLHLMQEVSTVLSLDLASNLKYLSFSPAPASHMFTCISLSCIELPNWSHSFWVTSGYGNTPVLPSPIQSGSNLSSRILFQPPPTPRSRGCQGPPLALVFMAHIGSPWTFPPCAWYCQVRVQPSASESGNCRLNAHWTPAGKRRGGVSHVAHSRNH